MKHSHRNTPPTTPLSSQPEPHVNLTESMSKFESLDPSVMDSVMLLVAMHPDTQDYVAMLMKMLGESKAYQAIRKADGATKSNFLKQGGTLVEAAEMEHSHLFAVAFLTGASCMLTAVDEGLVPDSGDGEDGEEGVE